MNYSNWPNYRRTNYRQNEAIRLGVSATSRYLCAVSPRDACLAKFWLEKQPLISNFALRCVALTYHRNVVFNEENNTLSTLIQHFHCFRQWCFSCVGAIDLENTIACFKSSVPSTTSPKQIPINLWKRYDNGNAADFINEYSAKQSASAGKFTLINWSTEFSLAFHIN